MSCGHIVDLDSGECLACGERRYTLVTLVECHTPDCDGGCKKAIAEREALNDAAPELLKELRIMVIQCCGSVEEPKRPNCTGCRLARDAIAKAEGR